MVDEKDVVTGCLDQCVLCETSRREQRKNERETSLRFFFMRVTSVGQKLKRIFSQPLSLMSSFHYCELKFKTFIVTSDF